MRIEKHILGQEMLMNGLNMGLQQRTMAKYGLTTTVSIAEIHRLSSKEKVSGGVVSKYDHAESIRTWKDPSLLISLEKVRL